MPLALASLRPGAALVRLLRRGHSGRVRRGAAACAAALVTALGVPLGGVALAGCTPPMSDEGDVALVTAFQVSPAFNNAREVCTVRYTLAAPALVSIRVTVEQQGQRRLVVELARDQREPKGGRSAAWRGVGGDGFFVPQGTYQVELLARRLADGSRSVSWTLPTFLYRD